MQVFFASDTHFGHKSIIRLSQGTRPGSTPEEHDEILIDKWNKVVGAKRCMVYLLGDVAMSPEGYKKLARLNGEIRIIMGNHEDRWLGKGRDMGNLQCASVWLPYRIKFVPASLLKYKHIWLSHCPIHPAEMRKCFGNVHGHVHNKTIDDPRYLNVSMEQLPGFAPITLEAVRETFKQRGVCTERPGNLDELESENTKKDRPTLTKTERFAIPYGGTFSSAVTAETTVEKMVRVVVSTAHMKVDAAMKLSVLIPLEEDSISLPSNLDEAVTITRKPEGFLVTKVYTGRLKRTHLECLYGLLGNREMWHNLFHIMYNRAESIDEVLLSADGPVYSQWESWEW